MCACYRLSGYSVRADALYIIAVMHLHRRPFYWKGRV